MPPGGDPARGLADAAYAALNTVEFPGYGFMLENGAVALWEHLNTLWDSTSRNHAWYGSVSVFLRRVVGGIGPAPGSRGFDKVLIKPIPQRLAATPRWANTTYDSARGTISTRWILAGDAATGVPVTFSLSLQMPANVDTTVELPLAAPVEPGGGRGGGAARFTSSCALLPPQLDSGAGVARWGFAGVTSCNFLAVWE